MDYPYTEWVGKRVVYEKTHYGIMKKEPDSNETYIEFDVSSPSFHSANGDGKENSCWYPYSGLVTLVTKKEKLKYKDFLK